MNGSVEHATGRIGQANAAVLDALAVAYRQALALVEDGYALQEVRVDITGRPVIDLRPTGRCRYLRGAWTVRSHDGRGVTQRMVSTAYPGVRVQWLERQ